VVIVRKHIAGLSAATLARFVLRARRAAGLRGPVNVLLTGDRELRALNRKFRGKNKTTDVLSFPASNHAPVQRAHAGDLAISVDRAKSAAQRLGHSAADEVKILVLHGILHLAGFDHERDNGEMAKRENYLRRQLKLESGLIERAQDPQVRRPRPNPGPRAPLARRSSA
jgi:probable rRNA maturation factor